jgi:BirA family biotin operon repressor/biotin-[acetyl-CoA-carboxylase] ligase
MAFALGSRATSTGTRLEAFETVESTSSEALARVRAGEHGPLWLVTAHQTAGHGRRHRPWISPPGNLAASIIQAFDAPRSDTATLGFAAGLALHETLVDLAGASDALFQLKWPNDLLLNGAKVAGILLEAAMAGEEVAVVAGFGVNIIAAPADTPYPATSLAAQGLTLSAEDIFAGLSDNWTKFVALWDNGRGFPRIRDLWLDRAAGLGEPMTIRNGGNDVSGTFETIDDAGCLVLKVANGEFASITAGDVHFGTAGSA